MKVLAVSHSDNLGGAARAAYRLHRALRAQSVDSRMLVRHAAMGDWTVSNPLRGWRAAAGRIAPHVAQLLCRLHGTPNPILRSPAFMPPYWSEDLNRSDADVIHLHWVAAEMLSIGEIGKIRKPLVWSLHDMWAFCGAEHCATDERWREGYFKSNRPANESGWDLNRWVWHRKMRAWRRPMHVTAPSRWLANSARQSVLMRDWPIHTIPNTLDTQIWSPMERAAARSLMNLPNETPIVAFGAWGVEQHHKGFDLLIQALKFLRQRGICVRLLVIGQQAPQQPIEIDYPVHYAGHLHDDLSLRVAYCAADVLVVPSRIEAFGQTASEAHACGVPVVAFDVCGLPDIVEHQRTGYLARPFDVQDLAEGIEWVLATPQHAAIGARARASAIEKFSYPVVAAAVRRLYAEVIEAPVPCPARP